MIIHVLDNGTIMRESSNFDPYFVSHPRTRLTNVLKSSNCANTLVNLLHKCNNHVRDKLASNIKMIWLNSSKITSPSQLSVDI